MAGNEAVATSTAVSSLMTVREAATALRISTAFCYELITQQRLPAVRLGRRILIPVASLNAFLEETTQRPGHTPAALF